MLKTYIARIQTPSGTETVFLSAASIEEATAVLQRQKHSGGQYSASYTIQEHRAQDGAQLLHGLFGATSALFACLLALVLAEYQLRKWLKH